MQSGHGHAAEHNHVALMWTYSMEMGINMDIDIDVDIDMEIYRIRSISYALFLNSEMNKLAHPCKFFSSKGSFDSTELILQL